MRIVPKLKPTTEETENRIVVGIIEKYQTIQDFSEEELANKIGVSVSTIYKWKKNPEPIPIGKIRMICKVLKIPNWEKVQMI